MKLKEEKTRHAIHDCEIPLRIGLVLGGTKSQPSLSNSEQTYSQLIFRDRKLMP